MTDQNRENVLGLTSPEFDHVGTSTLRTGATTTGSLSSPANGGQASRHDPREAREMIAKLEREIDARESRGLAGPGRDASWQTL